MFEKDMKYSLLLDFYGEVLSERRRSIFDYYYNEDLSLSEISEITGISRQGVRDSIKKSEAQLLALEEKLGLAQRFGSIRGELNTIARRLREIDITDPDADAVITSLSDELEKINP